MVIEEIKALPLSYSVGFLESRHPNPICTLEKYCFLTSLLQVYRVNMKWTAALRSYPQVQFCPCLTGGGVVVLKHQFS